MVQSLLQSIRHPLVVLNTAFGVAAANRRFYEYFRLSADEAIGTFFFDLPVGSWDHSALRALLEGERLAPGEAEELKVSLDRPGIGPQNLLLSVRRACGTCESQAFILAFEEVPGLEIRTSLVPDEAKLLRIRSGRSTAGDREIQSETERKRMSEELTDTSRLLRAIADNTADAIFVKDRSGKYLFFNEAAARFVGRPVEEVLGQDDTVLFAPESARLVIERDREVMESGKTLAKEEELTAAGTTRVYHALKTPYRDELGNVIGLIGVSRDITERKRAEEALYESEERFRAFMDHCPAASFIKDESGRFLYVNGAWRRQFTPEPVEWLGKTDFDFWPRESAELFRASDRACLEQGRPLQREESGQLPGSNLTRTWLVLKFPLEGGCGKRVGGMAWDVTEQRQLQAELVQAQKMEGIGRLAGGIAHDFNNMLAVINGYSQLVQRQLPEQHPLRDLVEEIGRAGERAAGLTRQLLAFSRRQLVELKLLDLGQVLVDLDKMLRRLIGEDIELVTLGGQEPLLVRMDAAQLEQVIVNLIVNARDAMPTGGALSLRTEGVDVEAGWLDQEGPVDPGSYVMLSVGDTGVGIAREHLPHIFEPFFTTKEVGKGTGLGLSTVYGIVKQAGGFLRFETEPGHGTTFYVYLPRVQSPAPIEVDLPSVALPQGSETILVVEDEPMVRRLMSDVLRGSGYTVLEAIQADEALCLVDTYPGKIDLLLSDVVMPRMSGPVLAEALSSRRPGIRVLFVSGYTDDAVVRHGVQAFEVELLQKPFSVQDLAERVRKILDRGKPGDTRDIVPHDLTVPRR